MEKNRLYNVAFIMAIAALLLTACGQELTDVQFYQNAQSHYKNGEIDAAVIQLKNALQKNASNLKARALLGRIYADLGQGAAAEKEIRRAISLGASETSLDESLAKALIYQNKYKEAYNYFSNNSGLSDDVISKRNITLTRILLLLGKVDDAKNHFAKVSNADKESIPGLYAKATLTLVRRDLPEVKLTVNKILQKNQKEIEAWIIKGTIAFEEGEAEKAEAAYISALNNYHSRYESILTFKANVGLFYAQLKQKKYEAALKTTQKLLAIAQDHPIPKYLRGLLAFEQKDYSTAQNYLDEVYSINSEHLPTQLLLGSIHYIRKNYEQANKYLSWVVNQVPDHVQARKMLAVTRMRLSRSSEALDVLEPMVHKTTDDTQLLAMVAAAAIQSGNLEMGEDYLKRAQRTNPNDTSLRAELAKIYMQKGEYDEAIKELGMIKGDQAVETDVLKVMSLLKKKDYVQARAIAEGVQRKWQNAASLSLLGSVELVAGDVAKAKSFFTQALGKESAYIPALLNLARLEFQAGNIIAAKEHFQTVIQKVPNNIVSLLGLAQISEKEGNIKSALAYMQEARSKNAKAVLPRILLARYYIKTGDINSAQENASEAYELSPKNSSVALLMANVYMLNHDPVKAVEVLESLKRVQPKESVVAYELARAYIQAKHVNLARIELNRALSINPKYYQAKIALARLEISQGKYDAALKEARSMQKLQPKEAVGYLLEGDVVAADHKYKQAEKIYRQSMRVKVTPLGYEKLANILLAQEKAQRAITELKNGVAQFPKAKVLQIKIATIYQTHNQASEAIKVYEKLLKDSPNHPVVLNNIALLYLDNGDNRALEYAKKAYNLIPSNTGIADTLGWVYAKKGDFDRALPLLDKAASKNNEPAIQYHYAYALYYSGKKEAAHEILKKLLAGNKQFVERSAAEKLRNLF